MERTLTTIFPRVKVNLLSMIIIEGSLIPNLFINRIHFFVYFFGIMMLIVLGYIIVLIRRLFFTKPSSVTLGENFIISTSNKKYDSSQIEFIYMSHKRIGLKLYGKRLVPIDLCFYFDKDMEVYGRKALCEWAIQNNKPIRNKAFLTLQ